MGDSFTEGVGDPDPSLPNGVRGWADRVAEVLSGQVGDFGYVNLAIRGRKMLPVLAEQLEPAVALRPDLVTFTAFDPGGFAVFGAMRGRFAVYNELVREVAEHRRGVVIGA